MIPTLVFLLALLALGVFVNLMGSRK